MPKSFAFCLCADDYAMTPGVSRGIIEALDAGALSATSVMTTSPWWPETAPALQRYDGRADIGLHLDLTMAAPLGAMPTFAPKGRFPNIRTIMRLARARRLPLAEIASEIDRQCDGFIAEFGRPPDHVDGHQHVHALPAIRRLLLDAIARRGWQPWVRDSADKPWRFLRRAEPRKALVLAVVGEGMKREAQRHGLACNEGFAGFSSFDMHADYGLQFDSYLTAPGRRHLVMCHPGYVDDALRRLDPVQETREQELRFLTSGLETVLATRRASLARLGAL